MVLLDKTIVRSFVPYRLVFPQWDKFYNDVIGSNYNNSSLIDSPPIIQFNTLVDLFTNSPMSTSIGVPDGTEDFVFNQVGYKYSLQGRRFLKILESLGYKVLFGSTTKYDGYNALALLAFCRVYIDWYANSQYLNSYDVLTLEQIFAFNDPTSHYSLTVNDLLSISTILRHVVYDSEDYYVNAWDNPVSPNSGQFTSFTFADPTSTGGAFIQTSANGSPEMITNTNYPQSIGTTYIHEALKKLTDYQKRHALAGARSIDRVLAQYGVITDSLKQMRSIYVGSQLVEVNSGSIFGTADGNNGTTSSSVGDYAGVAYGDGSGGWDFVPDEEGIFLVISSIIPSSAMVQGYDRNNLHVSKTDFFVPEFDSLGVQAISKGEVYVSDRDDFLGTQDVNGYQKVFGFSGRYAEYKRPKSFVTGDLRLPNFFQGGRSWYLARLFSDYSWSIGSQEFIDNVVHSLKFTLGTDGLQYNRVFQYNKDDYDPFFCFFTFNVAVHAPCKPLFETYDFDSETKRVPTENGNKLN